MAGVGDPRCMRACPPSARSDPDEPSTIRISLGGVLQARIRPLLRGKFHRSMARQASGAAARAEYAMFLAGRGALRALPLRSAANVGVCLGAITAALDRFNRPVALRNLEIAFPDWTPEERLATLKSMYRNWGRMAAEWCHMHELNSRPISLVSAHYEGVENWKRGLELSGGRGGFIFTGHFGNFELLITAHALSRQSGIDRASAAAHHQFIDAVAYQERTRAGNQMIARKGAAREMHAVLRRSGVIAVPIDLDVRRGVFVDFFSRKACTTAGLARLAIAANVPAVVFRASLFAKGPACTIASWSCLRSISCARETVTMQLWKPPNAPRAWWKRWSANTLTIGTGSIGDGRPVPREKHGFTSPMASSVQRQDKRKYRLRSRGRHPVETTGHTAYSEIREP